MLFLILFNAYRRDHKCRNIDPRQVRSLDFELLEEETENLRVQLHEEKAKNQYLQIITEDMKR